MEGGFFLLQHVDFVHGGNHIKGLEIIGHLQLFGEEPSRDIKSRYYDTLGSTFDYVYELEGIGSRSGAAKKGSPAYYQGTFSSDGNTNSRRLGVSGWRWLRVDYDQGRIVRWEQELVVLLEHTNAIILKETASWIGNSNS